MFLWICIFIVLVLLTETYSKTSEFLLQTFWWILYNLCYFLYTIVFHFLIYSLSNVFKAFCLSKHNWNFTLLCTFYVFNIVLQVTMSHLNEGMFQLTLLFRCFNYCQCYYTSFLVILQSLLYTYYPVSYLNRTISFSLLKLKLKFAFICRLMNRKII